MIDKWDDEAVAWECPCGRQPPKPGSTTIPVRTFVSLMEPKCHHCGHAYQDEYRVTDTNVGTADRVEAVKRHAEPPAA